MRPTNFDDDPMPQQTWRTNQAISDLPPGYGGTKGQAVVHLLRHHEIVSRHGEHQVRTTLDTHRAWRYRCSIWHRGREIRKEFVPIIVDRTEFLRQESLITEEMRIRFAMEAVDLHITRWMALQRYLAQSPGDAAAPRWYDKLLVAAIVIAVCAALPAGYWLWSHRHEALSEQPPVESPTHAVRWEQDQVSYELPAGKRFALLLPALENLSESVPVSVTIDVSGPRLNWLHFSPATLVISGTTPIDAAGRTFHLIFHAKPDAGHASPLHVYLTVTQ